MLGRFSKDAGSLLGVEIACDSVRMLQLQQRRGGCRVLSWALQALDTPLRDDWYRDPAPLLKALRSAYQRSGSRQRQVALALPGSEVICKVSQLPSALSASQMEDHLLTQAEHLFPFKLEDLAMDFHVQGDSGQSNGQVDVLVAACRQRSLDVLEQLLEDAGLEVAAVEVDSIALLRLMPALAGQGLLRIEPSGATLHAWSAPGLPQRQAARFASVDSPSQQLERVVQLVANGSLPDTRQLQLIVEDAEAAAWLERLPPRLGMPCMQLTPAQDFIEGQSPGCDGRMALAYGLALGGCK